MDNNKNKTITVEIAVDFLEDDSCDVHFDSNAEAAETATAMFLALMSCYDVPEEQIGEVYDVMYKEVVKARGGRKHVKAD